MSAAGMRALLRGALLVGLVGVLAWGVVRAVERPDGPEPVAWDRTACARCRMLVSDPFFAAQLRTSDGVVVHFDDPGCLLLYLDEARPEVSAVHLHHHEEERWLRREEAAFLPSGPSPMGYDLGAVERGRPGALSLEDALARVRSREATRGGSAP